MTLTLPGGTTQTVNLASGVDTVSAEVYTQYEYGADNSLQLTKVDKYFVRLQMKDGAWLDLRMGEQTGAGSGWTNDLAGANDAVADISAAMIA